MTRRRLASLAFWVALAVVLVAQLLTILPGFWLTRLWEDEAYNLTVPLNLLAGRGYSSDGLLSTGSYDLFDVRISTGPVVLLPLAAGLATGVDPVIAARAVMTVFYAGLLVALWFAGRRLLGRLGGLLAITVVLGIDLAAPPSPIQGPTDVLGEVPAALFLVLALCHFRRRPSLAGVLLGLAIQAKLLMVLSVPALAIGVFFAVAAPLSERFRRLAVFAVLTILPTVLFEAAKLAILGAPEYWLSTRRLLRFLRTGGQEGVIATVGAKLDTLGASWFAPWWLVLLTVLLLVAAALTLALLRGRRAPSAGPPEAGAGDSTRSSRLFLGTVTGVLLTWLTWWFVSSGDPAWIRHPAPALLATVPILAVAAAAAVRQLASFPGIGARVLVAAASTALVALLAVQLPSRAATALTPSANETLGQQRAAAQSLAELGYPRYTGYWGAMPPLVVLAGAFPVIDVYRPPTSVPLVLERFDRSAAAEQRLTDLVQRRCGAILLELRRYLVCEQRSSGG